MSYCDMPESASSWPIGGTLIRGEALIQGFTVSSMPRNPTWLTGLCDRFLLKNEILLTIYSYVFVIKHYFIHVYRENYIYVIL
jgi:hypothetical protein